MVNRLELRLQPKPAGLDTQLEGPMASLTGDVMRQILALLDLTDVFTIGGLNRHLRVLAQTEIHRRVSRFLHITFEDDTPGLILRLRETRSVIMGTCLLHLVYGAKNLQGVEPVTMAVQAIHLGCYMLSLWRLLGSKLSNVDGRINTTN